MTPQEAKLFLKIEHIDDVHDRWEEELFEIKRFLLISTPIPKVFESKLARLKKYCEAYEVLTGIQTERQIENGEEVLFSFSEEVETAFHELHKWRTHFKQALHQTNNLVGIESIISGWLEMEANYISKWKLARSSDIPDVVIQSKEPDPMELLQDIKLWKNSVATPTFQQLHNDFSFLPQKLRIEVKRLTLLSNYYGKRHI